MDSHDNAPRARHIAILLPSLAGGGAERSMLHLARSFAGQGRKVDLLLFRARGSFMDSIPESVRLVELRAGSSIGGRLLTARADPAGFGALLKPVLLAAKPDSNIRHIAALKRYLEREQPDIVLSALTYTNLVALWASRLSSTRTPVIVSERIALSVHRQSPGRAHRWRWRYILPLVARSYRLAQGVVAVSNGVADDLSKNTGLDRDSITTIYNPVVDETLRDLASQPVTHPWLQPGQPPVILGVGRLIPQKDFHTLLRAFARLRKEREARLIILGEGRLRAGLNRLADELDIANEVDMPGFVDNPYCYMAQASVFVLSSIYEGLPGVLIQALACGCPVISTDCPGGSAEILENGKYGQLVRTKDDRGLANAILSTLDSSPDPQQLKDRAGEFSIENATREHLALMDTVLAQETAKSAEPS